MPGLPNMANINCSAKSLVSAQTTRLPEIGVSPPPADTGASHHRDVEHPEPAAGSKLIRAVIRGNEGAASPAPAIRPASFAFAAG